MTGSFSLTDAHPSPKRGAMAPWRLLTGLAAGPFGWILQLLIDYGLSSLLCTGRRTMAQQPSSSGELAGLLAVNLFCLAIALYGLALSYGGWRKVSDEKTGGGHETLNIGEGRSRFIAVAGILTGGLFALAILFNTVEPFMIPACWSPNS
jgi:hypothetical protein